MKIKPKTGEACVQTEQPDATMPDLLLAPKSLAMVEVEVQTEAAAPKPELVEANVQAVTDKIDAEA